MPEEQEIPKQPLHEETSADVIVQASSIPPSETQPPNMEVHHHPDLHHKRKRFREYFFEFVMIFIAVTLGFFAESYREKLSENQKGYEYMYSMLEDLEADTSQLNQLHAYFKLHIFYEDSLINFLKSGDQYKKRKEFYELGYNILGRISGFLYSNRTVQQLRNAGNFRLIHNKVVSDGILKYDNWVTNVAKGTESNLFVSISEQDKALTEVLMLTELKNAIHQFFQTNKFPPLKLPEDVSYLSDDKKLFDLISTKAMWNWISTNEYIGIIDATNQNAKNLIATIKKEYKL